VQILNSGKLWAFYGERETVKNTPCRKSPNPRQSDEVRNAPIRKWLTACRRMDMSRLMGISNNASGHSDNTGGHNTSRGSDTDNSDDGNNKLS
jgi:hypothetical protein